MERFFLVFYGNISFSEASSRTGFSENTRTLPISCPCFAHDLSPKVLDRVLVNCYGGETPLNQVASVKTTRYLRAKSIRELYLKNTYLKDSSQFADASSVETEVVQTRVFAHLAKYL